jgi:uncharacterized protein (DUF3084 family)
MATEWCVPANRKPVIEESQRLLANEGFYSGPIDADWYNGSNAALHALKNDRDSVIGERDTAIGERDTVISERDAVTAERDAVQQSLDTANGVILTNQDLITQLEAQVAELEQRDPEASQRLAAARSNLIGFGAALGLKIEAIDGGDPV